MIILDIGSSIDIAYYWLLKFDELLWYLKWWVFNKFDNIDTASALYRVVLTLAMSGGGGGDQ